MASDKNIRVNIGCTKHIDLRDLESTRRCLVCECLEHPNATFVNPNKPWLCNKCKAALLKVVESEDTVEAYTEPPKVSVGLWVRSHGMYYHCNVCGYAYDMVGMLPLYCPGCKLPMLRKEGEDIRAAHEVRRDCVDCKYRKAKYKKRPCWDCLDFNKWEAWEE